MRHKIKRIYFCQYGRLCSITKLDAELLCKDAIKTGRYDLNDYRSFKAIKFRDIDTSNKYFSFYLRYGNKIITVYDCLDWGIEEWVEFQQLLGGKQ